MTRKEGRKEEERKEGRKEGESEGRREGRREGMNMFQAIKFIYDKLTANIIPVDGSSALHLHNFTFL
jgi:flagellar biosynthesis/type III secretory pathway protein FliH